MIDLFDLALQAQAHDEISREAFIQRFEPKVKHLSRFVPSQDRKDLEQELRMQMMRALDHFQCSQTPDFWTFINYHDHQ